MSDTITRARALIQARLAELDSEAAGLERALASLGEGAAPKRSRPPKRSDAKPRRKTGRAPRGQRREQLLAAVKANPATRPADLAREVGVAPAQVHDLIRKARKDKLLVRKGKGYALKR